MGQRKVFALLSLLCAVICILLWVPNIVFDIGSPWWLVIFFVSPAGVILGVMGRNIWFVIFNLIMFFSFLILMALGFDIMTLFSDLSPR